MSISAIRPTPAPAAAAPAPASKTGRAVDGDYLTPGAGRSTVKDLDGDYKAITPQANSSSATQAALSSLKLGG